jgi:PAS domain S-box-containing protein
MSEPTWSRLPIVAWTLDADGRLDRLNARAQALVGAERDDEARLLWAEAVHPADRAGLAGARARARRLRCRYTHEYRVTDVAQRVVWLEECGEPDPESGAYWCAATDVSERRARERGGDGATQFLNDLLSAIPAPLYVLDEEHTLIIVNDSFCQLMGLTRAELLGRGAEDVLAPGLAGRLRSDHDAAFASSHPLTVEEYLTDASGRSGWFLVHRAARQVHDGGRVMVGVITDIGPQKALERRLVSAHEAAVSASRAKSQFLANMSHEIRTPLNGVLGTLTLALHTALDPLQREYLDVAHSSAESLLTLLNNILDLSKIEAGHVQLEDLVFTPRDVVDELVKLYQPLSQQKGLALRLEASPSLPAAVRGDPLRLRQVLGNLIGNALKFTPSGGVTVRAAGTADSLQFEVEDTGVGIAPDMHERIFAPFAQEDASVSRRYGGTGLGLTICRELAELMGGSIRVDSAPRHGSVFTVTLPLRAVTLPPPPPAEAPARAAPQPLAVLVVDDNAVNRLVATRMLQKLGHTVEAASGGREAVLAVSRAAFDVVLMDVQMPEFDGLEATQAIREGERARGEPPRPIVALTAHAMSGDADRCRAAGMDYYLTKPLSLGALVDLLDQVEARRPSRRRRSGPPLAVPPEATRPSLPAERPVTHSGALPGP